MGAGVWGRRGGVGGGAEIGIRWFVHGLVLVC
jgi:hypothetical protein